MNSDDIERKQRRRQRLEGLRGQSAVTAPAAEAARPAVRGKAGGQGGGQGGAMAAVMRGEGDDNGMRRKAISRIMRLLTETPADATGMVPGTPFSQAGVARLMEMLDGRAARESGGQKAAVRLKEMLTAKAGEDAIHGASLQKLQRAGQMAGRRGGGGGGGGRRRGN